MTRGKWLPAFCVAAMVLTAAPAWAQRERGGGDSGGSSGGDRTGTAVDRSSPAPSSDSGSGARSSGDSGDSGAGRAAPRGSDRAAGSPGASGRSAGSGERASDPSQRGGPTYTRPRDGRNPTGTAVDRQYPYGGGGSGANVYYYPSPGYYGRYYYPGYAFGLGYLYDPGWYDPYYYGGGGYGPGYYSGGGSSSYGYGPTGSLRLKLRPRDAQVYVDGYFVGLVDNFDGVFQKLSIDAGGHRIEVRAPGYETTSFDVLITPGETVTYKGDMRRVP